MENKCGKRNRNQMHQILSFAGEKRVFVNGNGAVAIGKCREL